MIDFSDIRKSYGEQDIFRDVSFRINSGERVGVVGPNGSGKSTLFGIITKEVYPENGNVSMPKGLRTGYLKQHLESGSGSLALLDYVSAAVPELTEIYKEITEIEKNLSNSLKDPRLFRKLGELQHQYESLGGYEMKPRAEAALSGLGFSTIDFSKKLSEFSGGWQMRAGLARVLISRPGLLLLDEPSNYLDIPAIEWLYRYLKNFDGTLLLISHDRYLLKTLTGTTLEVNSGNVTKYAGDYDFYVREKNATVKHLAAANRNLEKKKEQLQRSIDRFRSKSSKASQVQSWIKSLDKMKEASLPEEISYKGAIVIPPAPRSGAETMRLENVSHSYDSSGWVLENVNLSIERGEKIGFIGFNGTGKTTLLKIMAGRFAPSKGKVITGHKVITGYQAQEFGEILPIKSTAYDVVKAIAPPTASPKGIRAVLGMFGFSGESAEKPCSVLSGGEKIRLCFARIFINPPNFLILDEPTTHLDIAAREALQKAVKQYNGTVCIVSHDIEFIRNSVSTIIAMSPPGVTKFYGGYDYYREKTAAVPEILSQTESSGQTDNTSFSVKKERRRERAEKRAGMLKIKKTAEKTLMKIEEKTERLEAEKKEITEKLINASEAVDFASLSRGIKEINGLIESATEEWEKAALELEEIEEKYESIHN